MTVDVESQWIESHQLVLVDFKNKIEQCVTDAEWEALPSLLNSRQAYLEQIFNQPILDSCRESLKVLVQSILADDVAFLAKVETQKNIVAKQQLSLDHGFRATQAYKNSELS